MCTLCPLFFTLVGTAYREIGEETRLSRERAHRSVCADTPAHALLLPFWIPQAFSFARFLAGNGELETAIATADEGLLAWADGMVAKNKAADAGAVGDGAASESSGDGGAAATTGTAAATAAATALITQPRPKLASVGDEARAGAGGAEEGEAEQTLSGVEVTAALLVKNKNEWKMQLYGAC